MLYASIEKRRGKKRVWLNTRVEIIVKDILVYQVCVSKFWYLWGGLQGWHLWPPHTGVGKKHEM